MHITKKADAHINAHQPSLNTDYKKSPARGQQPLDISRLNAVFVVSLSFKAEPAYQLLTYHFLPCTHQSNMNTC